MRLTDHKYIQLVIGPSGSGKTTYLARYAEDHHTRFRNGGYWITLPSIRDKLDELTPDWIQVTTDLFDERFAGAVTNPKRHFILVDEVNRIISKYKHASHEARAWVDLVSVHRHKGSDYLLSDQVFDFLRGARTRGHWMTLAGLSDKVYYEIADKLPPYMTRWLEQNYSALVQLGKKNRETIPDGIGRVAITDGLRSFISTYKVPKWYTQELSEIWQYVSGSDLKKDYQEEEEDIGVDYDFSSENHKSLMLAFHISNSLFDGKLTKEKLSAAYVTATMVISGSPQKLGNSGRGYPEIISAVHNIQCPWCDDHDEYAEVLQNIQQDTVKNRNSMSKELLILEKEVMRKIGGGK